MMNLERKNGRYAARSFGMLDGDVAWASTKEDDKDEGENESSEEMIPREDLKIVKP